MFVVWSKILYIILEELVRVTSETNLHMISTWTSADVG